MTTLTRTKQVPGTVETISWKTDETSHNPASSSYHGPQSLDYPLIIPSFEGYYEEISPEAPGNRGDWKPFEHYRIAQVGESTPFAVRYVTDRFVSGYPYYSYAYITSPYFSVLHSGLGEPGKLNVGLPKFHEANQSDGHFVLRPAAFDSLQQRALATMLPVIKSELSLPNSLFELKDLPSIRNTVLNVKKFAAILATTFNLSGRKTLRRALQAGSDVYLQNKFNILPMLSDIDGIHTALSSAEKRIRAFINREGRVQLKHFQFNYHEFPDTQDSAGAGPPDLPFHEVLPVGFYSQNRDVRYLATKFHMQIQYNYNYTEYQKQHAAILSLLDSVGFNLNPRIIWNAIPWSFVIDWIFGVGRFLDQLKLEHMRPQINIHRGLWSVLRERRIHVQLGYAVPGDWYHLSERTYQTHLPVVVETAYRRHVTTFDSSSIVLGGLDFNEFSLAAALVFSRRPRHTNKRK